MCCQNYGRSTKLTNSENSGQISLLESLPLIHQHLQSGLLLRPHRGHRHTQKKIEKVLHRDFCRLRRVARFVTRTNTREEGCVTNALKQLNWPSLEKRRQVARLTLMYKCVTNQTAIDMYIISLP